MNPHLWAANALDGENAPRPVAARCPGGINFAHPNFAMMCARTGLHAGAVSWFYVSYDRCKNWEGPYWLPLFGQAGIAARTDYIIDDPHPGGSRCTWFLTAARANGQEGPVLCARTTDGGQSIELLSWVTPAAEGYSIMPASLRLSPTRLLCAVRCSSGDSAPTSPACWIDLYASDDNGASWAHLGRPVPDTGRGGNPPTLAKLHDGRLCITFGFRNPPFGIFAVFSEDGGATWSTPLALREGAGNHDIGYPRTVQLSNGTMVTAYYFNDAEDGERYIAATLWQP